MDAQPLVDPTDPTLDGPIILPLDGPGNVLTELEIRQCWRHNLLAAADRAKTLAIVPAQGPTYAAMRENLKLAEGACRQMCHWREDARWLYLAPMLERTHQMCGDMIRSHYARPLFLKLELVLRKLVVDADALENKATGKLGMILPKPERLDRTEGRPVQVLQ